MTTKETLLQTKPPKDVIAELKAFESETGTDFAAIKDSFYEILCQPYLDQFESLDDRCRQASKILLAQFADKLSYRTAAMEFKVIEVTAVKTYDKKVDKEDPISHEMVQETEQSSMAKIFGLFAGTGDDDELTSKIGILNLWGDACQVLSQVEKDGCYSGLFGITEYEDHYDLTLNEPIVFDKVEIDVPPIKDMITNFFKPISVAAAEYNLSEDRNDFKLISGRVQNGRMALSKKGSNLGFLTLIDNEATIAEIKSSEAKKLSVMFSDAPEFATRYITGSTVYCLVTLEQSEQYGLSAFGAMVIPIIGIPGNSSLGATPPAPATPPAQPPAKDAIPPEPPVQQPDVPTQGEQKGDGSIPTGDTPIKAPENPEPPGAAADPEEVGGW